MEIFRYQPRFFEEIYKIHIDCFKEEAMTKSMLLAEILCPSRRYFVAVEGKDVLGYIGAWNTKTDYSIISIAVDPNYRRSGIAKALIKKIEEDCYNKGLYAISLEVAEDNLPAISLYRSQGYMITNARKNYYKGGKTAFVMWKYL